MSDIYDEIIAERLRQIEKWGEQNHPDVDQVLMNRRGGCTPQRMAEEYAIPTASRAQFSCNNAARRGQLTFAHILVEEVAEAIDGATMGVAAAAGELRTELIQVAAVAVAWVEKLDREARP